MRPGLKRIEAFVERVSICRCSHLLKELVVDDFVAVSNFSFLNWSWKYGSKRFGHGLMMMMMMKKTFVQVNQEDQDQVR